MIADFALLRSVPPPLLRSSIRYKSTNHWAKLKRTTFPNELAMQHFDNFYSKVYERLWPSVRLGLLTPNKFAAVVNTFCTPTDTMQQLESLGCIDLARYYKRHQKKMKRYQLRMNILKEKKAKKIAHMAVEQGIDPESINPDDVIVSDVSDSELREQGLISTSGSEAEDFVEMFQTDVEKQAEMYMNPASKNLNLNDFVEPTEFKYKEEIKEGDTKYYQFYQSEIDVPVEIIDEENLVFPEALKVYTFPRRNINDFPHPRLSPGINVFDYYCMDGASLLPPLVLGLKAKDTVADFCAAPGGKSLFMALSLLPSSILCNELTDSRMSRLKNVIRTYIPKMDFTNQLLHMQQMDAKDIKGSFDKILLDVPCTNDRISSTSNENNIFKSSRIKERIALPQLQCDLLFNAFKCLKPGGSLVYSTCSLSPIQNDGVVHMTLKRLQEETDIHVYVVNLKEGLRPFRGLFRFHRLNRYGTQVLPFLPSNFGPMYFCKFIRKGQ